MVQYQVHGRLSIPGLRWLDLSSPEEGKKPISIKKTEVAKLKVVHTDDGWVDAEVPEISMESASEVIAEANNCETSEVKITPAPIDSF